MSTNTPYGSIATVIKADGSIVQQNQLVGNNNESFSPTNPLDVRGDNLVLDHNNGVKVTVTNNKRILIRPTGCNFVSIYTTNLIFIKTDGTNAADSEGSYPIDDKDIIPINGDIYAYAPEEAIVYVIPYKNR